MKKIIFCIAAFHVFVFAILALLILIPKSRAQSLQLKLHGGMEWNALASELESDLKWHAISFVDLRKEIEEGYFSCGFVSRENGNIFFHRINREGNSKDMQLSGLNDSVLLYQSQKCNQVNIRYRFFGPPMAILQIELDSDGKVGKFMPIALVF